MHKLLTLKHWQIFALLIGIPVVFQFSMFALIMMQEDMTVLLAGFSVVLLFSISILFVWLYTTGKSLYQRLPKEMAMSLTRFKIALVVPAVYLATILVSAFVFMPNTSGESNISPSIFFLIVPLHLLSMVCIFYTLYFNAKALKAVEAQREIQFSEYLGEIFMFWFFPIGIWVIQPRLNKIFDISPASQGYSHLEVKP
jgi:hypothetical protein